MSARNIHTDYDILIKNAQLVRGSGGKTCIAIADGKIAALGDNIGAAAKVEIDAKGMLVSESFVNTHLHLCKVYTLQMMDEEALKDYHGADMGKAMTAIELAARVKEKYDASWIVPNVRKALAQAAIYGCTHIRAFADVDSKARLEGVKALIQARDEFRGVVDVQVVAFAQDGIVREPGAAERRPPQAALRSRRSTIATPLTLVNITHANDSRASRARSSGSHETGGSMAIVGACSTRAPSASSRATNVSACSAARVTTTVRPPSAPGLFTPSTGAAPAASPPRRHARARIPRVARPGSRRPPAHRRLPRVAPAGRRRWPPPPSP